jgi:hypothetical protein
MFYNIILILIKLRASVGFNCNNSIIVHEMGNVKFGDSSFRGKLSHVKC